MQRHHRIRHRLTWLLLAPLLVVAIWIALRFRPPAPINERLPDVLSFPAAPK